jgi:excisionase family DNA binding protein
MKHQPTTERATLTPKETQALTGFGTNATYQLLRDGSMPSIKVGARYFVPRAALRRWLENCGGKVA